jgi:hypothetical protein
MTSPLATVFSMLDRLKRNLSPRGMESTIQRTAGSLEDFGRLQARAAAGDKEAEAQATEIVTNQLLNFISPGITLFHGGPQAIAKVAPDLLGRVGTVQGKGFYTSNKLGVPYEFAKNARESLPVWATSKISAYEFPDDLYARTLQVNAKPLSKYPDAAERLMELVGKEEGLKKELAEQVKFMRQGSKATADATLTGELVDSVLRRYYGGYDAANAALNSVGLTGRTWQYSAKDPRELATLIYPNSYDSLEFLGAVPVRSTAGPQNFKATQSAMKNLLATVLADR